MGRHSKIEPTNIKIHNVAHKTGHSFHEFLKITALGLPAILAFEAARPIWTHFVEHPIAQTLNLS